MTKKRSNNKNNYKLFINFILINFILKLKLIEGWTLDVQPRLNLKYEQEKLPVFFSNNKTSYFKLLDQDDNTILIGARNAVYNLTINNLIENYKQRIEWSSSDADRELCALKGKFEMDCQNYIRVFAKVNDKQIMVCGTNSYKPRCRYYTIQTPEQIMNEQNNDVNNQFTYKILNEIEAQGRCPYNPHHNSTYIYTDGQLYSATVADFSGADSLIYREPQRTEQSDLKQLNQPQFVSTLERNGYVFFFFREIAMEYMNCGKAIYSRVGRVCKNDKGGPYGFSDRWTTFLKTRLNCSVPGEYPFYFDEIQATSQIIDGKYLNKTSSIVYGVFTTSQNAIPGSAICIYNIDDIINSFDGLFKSQKDINSNWLPIKTDEIPQPRPGKCVDDSRTLTSTSVNFVKQHPLMDIAVPSLYDKPILTHINLKYRLTSITIDSQIKTLTNTIYDILFVGTNNGKIIKLIIITDYNNQKNFKNIKINIISEIQVLKTNEIINELSIKMKNHKSENLTQMNNNNNNKLIIISNNYVITTNLDHCNKIKLCTDCINIQDPYCLWDIRNHECISQNQLTIKQKDNIFNMKQMNFIQNIENPNDGIKLCLKNIDQQKHQQQNEPHIILNATNLYNINKNDNNNDDYNSFQQRSSSTHGTVTSIGKLPNQQDDNQQEEEQNNDNSIVKMTTVNISDLKNTLNGPLIKEEFITDDNLRVATSNIYWCFAIIILILVFAIGIFVGLYVSKRFCKTPLLTTGFDHRNQLTKSFNSRNTNGKDVNLLMNTQQQLINLHHNATQTTALNKKDNNIVDQEFNVVNDKDRSHECKNSTENLEKEHNSKTGTLTKVKRTYI